MKNLKSNLGASFVRREVRNAVGKNGTKIYRLCKGVKAVLMFDPEYGYGTLYCGKGVSIDTFNTALQALQNICKLPRNAVLAYVMTAREMAVDEENYQFYMPSTRELIKKMEALE